MFDSYVRFWQYLKKSSFISSTHGTNQVNFNPFPYLYLTKCVRCSRAHMSYDSRFISEMSVKTRSSVNLNFSKKFNLKRPVSNLLDIYCQLGQRVVRFMNILHKRIRYYNEFETPLGCCKWLYMFRGELLTSLNHLKDI